MRRIRANAVIRRHIRRKWCVEYDVHPRTARMAGLHPGGDAGGATPQAGQAPREDGASIPPYRAPQCNHRHQREHFVNISLPGTDDDVVRMPMMPASRHALACLVLRCRAPRSISSLFILDLDFYPYRVNSTRSEMIDHSLIKRNKNDNVLKSFTVLTVRWLQMVIFLDTTGYYLLYLS